MSTSPLSLIPRVRFWHVLAMLVAATALALVIFSGSPRTVSASGVDANTVSSNIWTIDLNNDNDNSLKFQDNSGAAEYQVDGSTWVAAQGGAASSSIVQIIILSGTGSDTTIDLTGINVSAFSSSSFTG